MEMYKERKSHLYSLNLFPHVYGSFVFRALLFMDIYLDVKK